MRVTLTRWGDDDLPVLERSNSAEMTRFLGGPETAEQVRERHERYLRLWAPGEDEMYRIDVDGVAAGVVGYWSVEEDPSAYEAGWAVLPEWQGRGVAREALRLIIGAVRDRGHRGILLAYPSIDNAASNALCRGQGFEHRGAGTMPWRGTDQICNEWALDLTSLDLTERSPQVDETFEGAALDESRWWPFYTPHWSSRKRTAAGYTLGDGGLSLEISADTVPWAPELDGEIRVSHLQTGQFSGPVGSTIGQHRFREGLTVREEQPERRLWLPQFGVIEARLAAIRHPDVMVAFWPIGFEQRPSDCGEICIAEIFGSELDDDGGWVGVGVKAQNDPRLRTDFEKIRIGGDLTEPHDYAVEWTADRLRFFIDGRWVKTVAQRIDYPVQFMIDVYEFPRSDGSRDLAALPHRFAVQHVRSYGA